MISGPIVNVCNETKHQPCPGHPHRDPWCLAASTTVTARTIVTGWATLATDRLTAALDEASRGVHKPEHLDVLRE
jgi:hypothetical protein